MRARFYRLNPQGYQNMVRDIADRLLLDKQADEVAILQTVKAKLTAEEYQLVATALDQMAQRSRHIATQLCVVSKEVRKVQTPLQLRARLLISVNLPSQHRHRLGLAARRQRDPVLLSVLRVGVVRDHPHHLLQ